MGANSKNRFSETSNAINEFKRKKVVLKEFAPSDHSRFMPPKSEERQKLDTDIPSNESEGGDNRVDENLD